MTNFLFYLIIAIILVAFILVTVCGVLFYIFFLRQELEIESLKKRHTPDSQWFESCSREIKKHLEQRFEKYNEQIRSLGLPVPELDIKFFLTQDIHEYKTVFDKINVSFCGFLLPEYIFLLVCEDRFCTFTGNAKELSKILKKLSKNVPLQHILESIDNKEISVAWTNQNPYDAYFCFHKQISESRDGIPCSENRLAGFIRFASVVNSPLEKHWTLTKAINGLCSETEAKCFNRKIKIPSWGIEEVRLFERKRVTLLYFLDFCITTKYVGHKSEKVFGEDLYSVKNTAGLQEKTWWMTPGARFDDLVFDKYPYSSSGYSRLRIIPSQPIKAALMSQFFDNLSHSLQQSIVFSLIAANGSISFEICCSLRDLLTVERQLRKFFPDFSLIKIENDSNHGQSNSFTAEKHLIPQNFNFSLKTMKDFHLDPYQQICDVLSEILESGEQEARVEVMCAPFPVTLVQVLINKANEIYGPKEEYLESIVKPFEMKNPAWLINVRISASGQTKEKSDNALTQLELSLKQYVNIQQQWTEFEWKMFHLNDLVKMTKSNLVTLSELVGLAHFPIMDLKSEHLELSSVKAKLPPPLYSSGITTIGISQARGKQSTVYLPEEVRDRHIYILGKSGTGKSTLIESIVRQDIHEGRGVAVIDPHGDMITHLLETMPEHRANDCILFSPKHCPISLEILSAENEHEIDLLSDDLITMFRRTSESWGDKMQAILQMAFQTLLRVPGSSFTDITKLLTDENYRRSILSQIDHPQLAGFWEHRYDMKQAEPILIRMDRLTTSGVLRGVLTQSKRSLNFYDVISESKIFLADLSKGFLGESTSHLLGSIIVSQIQLAAMRQAHLPIEQRIPFSLFVDEVQNFTTSAFSTILSEARKQKLRLTIAHQFVSQLPQELQKAVFGNVGTMMFFALSPDDLGAARHELGSFEAEDVANLPKFHALCRPSTAARDTFSFVTDPPPPHTAKNFTQTVIEQTRQEYGIGEATAPENPTAKANTESQQKMDSKKNSSPQMDLRRPSPAFPLSFATNGEKILHFLRQAEYLSQPQIIALTDLQASNASTALKKLVETGQIKSLDDRRPKIYFTRRTANPTTHNLLVRDLFVKINRSNYHVRSVKFNDNLAELNPDLTVEFVAEDGVAPLLTYFELDRGTEGVQELVRKAERYAQVQGNPRVCFIFEREPDMLLARKTIQYPFITYATLDQFTSLRDSAFYAVGGAADNDI
jgi:ribosomal protein S25